MDEQLEIYDKNNNLIATQSRKLYYKNIQKEFKNTGTITKKIKTVKILMMNSFGRIYLQKRSILKTINPSKYDKAIAGHILPSDTDDITVTKESAEELWFPAMVVNKEIFARAVKTIDINIMGIFKKIDQLPNFQSKVILKGGINMIFPQITSIYVGYFDGPIKFIDWESSGIEMFTLHELLNEMENTPDKFTEDILFFIKKYQKHLIPFQS